MATSKNKVTVRHNPNPVQIVVTEAEIDQLKDKAKIPAKENTFFLVGLFIPSLVNLINEKPQNLEAINLFVAANLFITIISFILGLIQAREWWSKHGQFDALVTELKEKPEMDFVYTSGPSYTPAQVVEQVMPAITQEKNYSQHQPKGAEKKTN